MTNPDDLQDLLRAMAKFKGVKYPLFIDHDGDLYSLVIAAGGTVRPSYYPAEDDKPATVIDSVELSIDGKRWGRSLTVSLQSRTASPNEMREHDEAQQALAVLGAERGEA
jgi:hypothetical protein